MKKIYLLTIVILITATSQAQIQFGVKGGINVSGPFYPHYNKTLVNRLGLTRAQNDSANADYSPRGGFQLGILADIQLIKNGFRRKKREKRCFLSLSPEVLFAYQNYSVDKIGNVNLLNINVPIMVKLSFGKSWFIELGPYIDFLLDQKHTGDHPELLIANSSISMGGATGIGCLLPSGHIGFDLRTSIGTDMPDNLTAHPINTMTQLDIFYLFGKRSKQ
jgi:hypothetical protein